MSWIIKHVEVGSLPIHQLAQFLSLWNTFNTESIGAEELVYRIKDSESRIILAYGEDESEIVGFALASKIISPLSAGAICELWAIFVRPEHRQKRIGHALLEAVYTFAHSCGCVVIWITTRQDVAVSTFYYSCGYFNVANRMALEVKK